jgi:hypothetical protein
MLLKIKGQRDIYKDSESSAIISKQNEQYEEHKKRVAGQKRINTVIDDVQYLKEEMEEIKQMLRIIRDK